MNSTCGVSKIQIIPEQVSAQRQWREAYPGRQNKQIRKSGINRHTESDIWNGRVKNLSARYMIKFTSHPSIPGTSVTSSPRVKIGLTVIWKYGGSTKHNRTRPRKGHLRRNFTPIRTYKRIWKSQLYQKITCVVHALSTFISKNLFITPPMGIDQSF